MTLSGLGLLTMWEFRCVDVSFFVSSLLKTILPALLKDFWSSPPFLAFKTFISPWSFTTQHSDFSSFLAVSATDKVVNRSIHAYALIFLDIHIKQARSSSNSGYKIQTKKGWKINSRTRTFGAAVHKSNIRVKRWHNKYENSELDWKSQLLFKWFSYQVQSYWNTDL